MIGLIVYLLISLMFGIITCFLGKNLYFPVARILICIITFNICLIKFGFNVKGLLISAGIAILVMVLIKFFYELGVLLIGGICGAVIGAAIVSFLPVGTANFHWIIISVCTLAVSICCLIWTDNLLMLTTSYVGASIIVPPVCFFILELNNLQSFIYSDGIFSTMLHLNNYLNGDFATQHAILLLGATLLLTAVSYYYQSRKEVTA